MNEYDTIRNTYKPKVIKALLIAESPPPSANKQSSRHFYRTDQIRKDDRLFVNTIKALYPETAAMQEEALQTEKSKWLNRFKSDGWYMIEALEESMPHEVTKKQRQALIEEAAPALVSRVQSLAAATTKIILIKSNVFDKAKQPLEAAGFTVLNDKLLDYPGHFNQKAYREKLTDLAALIH